MTKKKIILGAITLGLLTAGIYLYFNLGSIITRTTERIAGNALGVAVDIGHIDLSLSEKKVIVSGIKISNPKGYKGSHIITTDTISIGLNTATRELIDFKDIQVTGSVVNLEVNENGMNLIDLKNLAGKKKQKESTGSKQIRVIVKNMVIDASVIKPRITFLDRDLGDITVPALRFSNLGQGGGMDAGDAIASVLSKYLGAVEKQARQSGLFNGVGVPNMKDVEKTLDNAKDTIKGLFQ